jgi:hypothetical protein
MNNTLPHLFYTDVKTTVDDKQVIQKTYGQTFIFLAQDVHLKTCLTFVNLA